MPTVLLFDILRILACNLEAERFYHRWCRIDQKKKGHKFLRFVVGTVGEDGIEAFLKGSFATVVGARRSLEKGAAFVWNYRNLALVKDLW